MGGRVQPVPLVLSTTDQTVLDDGPGRAELPGPRLWLPVPRRGAGAATRSRRTHLVELLNAPEPHFSRFKNGRIRRIYVPGLI